MRIFIIILFSIALPWAIGIFLYFKDKKLIAVIAPVACMVAFVLNTPGIEYGFFFPPQVGNVKSHTLGIFANVGLFTILPCICIYLIKHTKIKAVYINGGVTVFATLIDLILIKTKFLIYDKGWSIALTLLFYFIALSLVYIYYLWLKKLDIFQH